MEPCLMMIMKKITFHRSDSFSWTIYGGQMKLNLIFSDPSQFGKTGDENCQIVDL
jgi:hypothetical protein